MNLFWLLIVFAYIALTHLVAKLVGEKRKIGYGKTVFLSLLLSPLIAFFIAKLSTLNAK